ncbi:hypothetical protein PUN28_011477 [Cardiocondyla obscurior]|uniref:Uncharacterized protein n=1 Tax=Cardiocondyla obscurior TaxID=286306 RepID=A0AAW2FJF6_9HYME
MQPMPSCNVAPSATSRCAMILPISCSTSLDGGQEIQGNGQSALKHCCKYYLFSNYQNTTRINNRKYPKQICHLYKLLFKHLT